MSLGETVNLKQEYLIPKLKYRNMSWELLFWQVIQVSLNKLLPVSPIESNGCALDRLRFLDIFI